MKPSARLKTAQDLLGRFFDDPSYPLDLITNHHFRKNRYIGGGDRRAIQVTLYEIIREYLVLDWRVKNANGKPDNRSILLAHLIETETYDEALFAEGGYGLEPLTGDDKTLVKALMEGTGDMPDWARVNCPEWLLSYFLQRFPDSTEEELKALQGRAPLDIRVNSLKSKPDDLAEELTALGFQAAKYSPLGFRSIDHINLVPLEVYQKGTVEVQDEGSQLAMLLADARPGMQVADLCAGAGGKTLGLAAEMANKGQIHAFDINEKRLKELAKRMQKAGVRNVQASPLPAEGRDTFLAPFANTMDRVVLDVPCSGSGTWRRSPDQRFALTDARLAGYIKTQKALLLEGANQVKPKGRLVYITCSLFREEAEDQVAGFLESQKGWQLLDYREILKSRGVPAMPETTSSLNKCLLLSPGRHGTDGFFVAVLEKP